MDASNERLKVVKIFVGKGDYKEQDVLADKRERQGWVVGTWDEDDNIQDALKSAAGSVVVINGGHAGDCVARVAARALKQKARRVVVPLPDIMGGDGIDGRARNFAWRLNHLRVSIDDERLTITPSSVWMSVRDELISLLHPYRKS